MEKTSDNGNGQLPAGGPMQAAQRLARPELPRRFYRLAEAAAVQGGFELRLDGRGARTPAKSKLVVPSPGIGEAIAAEWNRQGDIIDPSSMPLTRIVNSAIDGVARNAAAVHSEFLAYAGSDLLCYRAEEPEGLVERQDRSWSPLVRWLEETYGVRLSLAAGIIHVPQEAEALAKLGAAVAGLDPFALAALHTVTTLTGSAILALATARGRLSAEEAWAAAHVDEDWQIARWGEDAEAMRRRALRWREMEAAALILKDRMGSA